MNEPKPQTPLTDAAFANFFGCEFNDYTPNQKKALLFARSLELKLQEAERQRDEAKAENVKLTAKLVKLQ